MKCSKCGIEANEKHWTENFESQRTVVRYSKGYFNITGIANEIAVRSECASRGISGEIKIKYKGWNGITGGPKEENMDIII